MIRPYEILFILRPDLGQEDLDACVNRVKSHVKKFGGTIGAIKALGQRKLETRFRKYSQGNYMLMNFKAPNTAIADIQKLLSIDEQFIRHMIVTASSQPESKNPTTEARHSTVSVKPDSNEASKKELAKEPAKVVDS